MKTTRHKKNSKIKMNVRNAGGNGQKKSDYNDKILAAQTDLNDWSRNTYNLYFAKLKFQILKEEFEPVHPCDFAFISFKVAYPFILTNRILVISIFI